MANQEFYFSFDINYPNTSGGLSMWNKQYSLNAYYAGKHWAARKKDADFWHLLVMEALQKTKKQVRIAESPVKITVLFHDGLDCSNHAAMVKMIEDAMKGKLIQDDSPKYVQSITMGFHNEHCIRVIVENI